MIKRAIILILIFAGLYWLTTSLRKDPTEESTDNTKTSTEETEKTEEASDKDETPTEAVEGKEEMPKEEATKETEKKTVETTKEKATETTPKVIVENVTEEKIVTVPTVVVTPKPAPRVVYPSKTTAVKVYLYEWSVDISKKVIPAGTVQFEVINSGRFSHDFAIKGVKNFGKVAPHQSANFSIKLLPGEYELLSGRRDDYENGMSESITIVK